jgi:hypothetical protein
MHRNIRVLAVSVFLAAAIGLPAHMNGVQAQERDGRGAARGGNTPERASRLYIVQMAELPVASYDGRLANLRATKPERGQKIDREAPDVTAYEAFLNGRHDQMLGRAGGGRKVYDYNYTFNGFAAELSAAQAELLKTTPGVLKVMKDELRHADTSSTPAFLGLDDPDGLWNDLGGVNRAGEDIVIGVVDSGVWPESDSFADGSGRGHNKPGRRDDGRGRNDIPRYHPLHGWRGKCFGGEQFPRSTCNDKLIAARHFDAAWGGDAGLKAERPWEFASPRDYNGHGTHTASTAGGNHGVRPNGPAKIFGPTSGIAPRARIAVYKALWSTQDGAEASGFTSDLVAAIDQAVADGVDVINYSVSGTSTNFLDPAELAFLSAADAGVFVSASAGNDGPTASTVAHPSPWITTVAAGTHNRDGKGSVTLGNGTTYNGASLASAAVTAPLINAAAAGLAGASAAAVRQCFTAADNGGMPALDPAKVSGKIVVCDRGVNARVNKSFAVRTAGGVGMILVNTSPSSINADFHFVPTVHLADTVRSAVVAYAATASAQATIAKATLVYDVPAPFTAAFSSRGPLLAGAGDLLKPDLIAPGQDILASVAPPGNNGLEFNVYSGTSMSAPHVAGLAALLKDLHHDWSPMMIKSALMTSAGDVLDGPNTSPAVIFSQGAGHVTPNDAANPGLVYDSALPDWLAFLCGATGAVPAATCNALVTAGYSLDPSDLNSPSIAIGDLAGVQTVTRRVTNVGYSRATYRPSITGMAGFDVSVSPRSLTINPGKTKSFTVTMTRTAAPLNAYTGGQLSWSDGRHTVRSPLIVRPVALAAPAEVEGTGGPISYGITFGYSGAFSATTRGLVPASTSDGTVADDPGDSFDPAGPGVVAMTLDIPAGITHARFSLFDSDVTPGNDLDLYVFKGETFVGGSGSGTSEEQVDLEAPSAGAYTVYVHGFGVTTGTANFRLFSWQVPNVPAGNMAVTAPTTAVTGATGTVTLTFNNLAPATRYLGSVPYAGSPALPVPTLVSVHTP